MTPTVLRGLLVLSCGSVAAATVQHIIMDAPNSTYLRPPDTQRDDGFVFCSMHFNRDRTETASSGWNTDYPGAGRHMMMRLPEISYVRTAPERNGWPVQWVTSVDRDDLFLCPFVLASDFGTANLSEGQAARLSTYLQKGGFLWIDDTWGPQAWGQILRELGKVIPESWVVHTPTFDHPIYLMLYHVQETLQVSNNGFWKGQGHTAERDDDSPVTPLRVVVDEHNRVAVVITHNTDIADTWERENDSAFFEMFAAEGYALGSNVIIYAMSH